MKLTKKYKPGQLVTINNKVYRIVKLSYVIPCNHCDARSECFKQCFYKYCTHTVGVYCYFKLVQV